MKLTKILRRRLSITVLVMGLMLLAAGMWIRTGTHCCADLRTHRCADSHTNP